MLKVSERGIEGSIPFIALTDPDQMIGVSEVEFEDGGIMKWVEDSVVQG